MTKVRVGTPQRAAAGVLATALFLGGCSGGGEASPQADASDSGSVSASASPSATSSVDLPEGVSLTDQGSELSLGESATVVYHPDQQHSTVLELSVDKLVRARLKDFSGFVLDDRTRQSRPYYVDVTVHNIGDTGVGKTPVPLYADGPEGSLIQSSRFTTGFDKCESKPLPAKFGPDKKTKTCLVFLVPDKGRLSGITFRPAQDFEAITWTGKVVKEKQNKSNGNKQGKKKQGKKNNR